MQFLEGRRVKYERTTANAKMPPCATLGYSTKTIVREKNHTKDNHVKRRASSKMHRSMSSGYLEKKIVLMP
jgi:hypothetical protein